MLLPQEPPRKYNKDEDEDNNDDEKGEVEELKEGEHLPNLNLIWDDIELDDMDDDVMDEDCVGIDYILWIKGAPSTSNLATIASTSKEASTEKFLEKDKDNEKDSTANDMVTNSHNPNKPIMFSNPILDDSYFKTFFGKSYVELSSFVNSYTQSDLLHCTQIVEPNFTLVDISFTNSCA